MRKVLVCGAGGFIGGHLVKKLKKEGAWARGVDIKQLEFANSPADEFIIGDLTRQNVVEKVLDQPFDEVYQLVADMGGAGYIFTGKNDANLMHNSATINLNIIQQAVERLMNSDFEGPVNIGSEEMISLNDLAKMVIAISGKKLSIYNKPVSYEGVRGRRSDNRLIQEKLGPL